MTISSYGLHRPLDMAPEFHNPKIPIVAGEIVEGVILDYENVVGIVSGQRVNEESVEPAPCEGWDPTNQASFLELATSAMAGKKFFVSARHRRNRDSCPGSSKSLRRNTMSTIEERLAALEKRAPVRGPAGDISAAVRNATIASNAAIADAESRIKAAAAEAFAKVQDEVVKLSDLARKLRQEVEDAKKFLDDRIQNTVDANLVKALQEYHVLDGNCTPTHWSK